MKKLNIGCGNNPQKGYINIDKYYFPGSYNELLIIEKAKKWEGVWKYGDAVNLQEFKDNEFDEVMMVHTLEHLSMEEGNQAIQAAVRVCKPGGFVEIEVPDLIKCCKIAISIGYNPDPKGDNGIWHEAMGNLYGTTGKDGEGQFHLCGYAKDYLKAKMEEHHLKNVREIPERRGFGHGPDKEWNLRMIGFK